MTNATQTTVHGAPRLHQRAGAEGVGRDHRSRMERPVRVPRSEPIRPATRRRYIVRSTAEMQAQGAPDPLIDGEVLECEPPTRLVQTWRAFFTPETAAEGFTRLTWELDEERPGLTRVTVTHDVENAPNVAAATTGDAKMHEGGGGWAWILSDLKTLLESGQATN